MLYSVENTITLFYKHNGICWSIRVIRLSWAAHWLWADMHPGARAEYLGNLRLWSGSALHLEILLPCHSPSPMHRRWSVRCAHKRRNNCCVCNCVRIAALALAAVKCRSLLSYSPTDRVVSWFLNCHVGNVNHSSAVCTSATASEKNPV